MNPDNKQSILEELRDVQSLPELEAIVAMDHEDYRPFEPEIGEARKRLSQKIEATVVPATASYIASLAEKIAMLERMVAAQSAPAAPQSPPPKQRVSKKYQLLSFDVNWSTKPQVHAIATLLREHADVGDVLAEDDIVRIMEANVHVLETKQGGERIWKYYKGTHMEGLEAHGNIVEVK